MWEYNNTISSDELYHYGTLGMKWGHRKHEYQKDRVKKLENKRNNIYEKKGAASNSYLRTSKNLYLQRSKMRYTKAKLDNNPVEKIMQKSNIKTAKNIKKYGMLNADSATRQKVYGSKLSNREKDAINTREWSNYENKIKAKKALKVAAVVTPIAVSAGVAYYNKNSNKMASKLNSDQLNKLNKGIDGYNKAVNFINTLNYKAKYQYGL